MSTIRRILFAVRNPEAARQPGLEKAIGIAKAFGEMPLPDLILLDVMLPDINGFDVLNRIRRHAAIQAVPVIMLTSRSETADIARGLSLGADAYLTKPVLPSTLIDAVQAVLGG